MSDEYKAEDEKACGCNDECGENCDCDCDDEHDTVTLELDDGTEVECDILTVFQVEGYADQQYIALVPQEEDSDDVYLYRFSYDGEGDPQIENITDDEEYEAVADAFDEMLDEEEFDETVGQDEEDDKQ